jgi:stage II sporulation protein D
VVVGRHQWVRLRGGGETELILRGPLQVRIGATRWEVAAADGAAAPLEGLGPIDLESASDDQPHLAIDQALFPGALRLLARQAPGEPGIDVVNFVGMEDYLPGVVASELFDHWHFETRAAQAIAARSFAASEEAWFRDRRAWDLASTEQSQVYRGRVDHAASRDAVAMTRGVVLGYEDRLVSGYYSSCCGGTAASAVDAIGGNPINDTPPLRGRAGTDVCVETRAARWTVERALNDIAARLAAWAKRQERPDLAAIGEPAAIEPCAWNDHGRPARYAIAGRTGARAEIAAEHLRLAGNFAPDGIPRPARPLLSSHVSVAIAGASATIAGRGHGHGAGLCQYGAQTLARGGTAHEEILRWYYPGVEIVTAY